MSSTPEARLASPRGSGSSAESGRWPRRLRRPGSSSAPPWAFPSSVARRRRSSVRRRLLISCLLAAACACAPARYPARESGCPVRSFVGEPTLPVDELGPVTLDCAPGGKPCERQLLDAVCAVGGDVAWGTGESSIGATHLTARAAH